VYRKVPGRFESRGWNRLFSSEPSYWVEAFERHAVVGLHFPIEAETYIDDGKLDVG